MSGMDPQKSKRSEAKSKSKQALTKLGVDLAALDLTEHEELIASEVVAAEDIGVTFAGAFFVALFSFLPPSTSLGPVPCHACPSPSHPVTPFQHAPSLLHRSLIKDLEPSNELLTSLPSSQTDVGGLDPIIGQLREAVIFPLCYPQLFESSAGLFGAPKGVLLYGPPGCGKTMLAKVRLSFPVLLLSLFFSAAERVPLIRICCTGPGERVGRNFH
jgi:hypothetical protein